MGNRKYDFWLFLFITFAVFYFTPSFLSSAIWKTGSSNYLWMITISLAFVYPYFKLYNSEESKDGAVKIVLFFFFGIVAGWTNENLAPVLFIIVLAYTFLLYKEKKIIAKWTIAGIVGVAIGCSLMILAPGNAVRAEVEGYPSLFNSFGEIINRLPNLQGAYRYFMLRLIILYALFLAGNYYFVKNKRRRKMIVIQSLIFFASANISLWITLLSPTFPPRAFMSITVLTIVSVAMLYTNIDFKRIVPKVLNLALLALLFIYVSVDYITFFRGLQFLDREIEKREKIIDDLKANGERKATFEKIYMDYRFEYSDFDNYYKDYYNMDVTFVEKFEEKDNAERE